MLTIGCLFGVFLLAVNIVCPSLIHGFSLPLFYLQIILRGRCGRDRLLVGFTSTYAISATIDVVSLNLDQGEVYNIM